MTDNGNGSATVRGLAGLHSHHLADLRASGLTDETIIASGCYTEDRHGMISAMLNGLAYPKSRGPALVIPFRESTGELNGFRRCKPTIPAKNKAGKPIKYLSPKDTPSRCYFPVGIGDTIADPAARLLITEGEKKTLAGMQAGFPTIGLTGAWNWKLGKGADRLIADLEGIGWAGRPVLVVFDSDAAENENVKLGESRLAAPAGTHWHARLSIVREGGLIETYAVVPADAAGEPDRETGGETGGGAAIQSADGAGVPAEGGFRPVLDVQEPVLGGPISGRVVHAGDAQPDRADAEGGPHAARSIVSYC